MAKNVARVNGRNGESMWRENDSISFKSNNVVHTLEVGDFTSFDILNVEDARKAVEYAGEDAVGAWTKEAGSTKGKSSLLVGTGKHVCWVMEITKNQAPNAISFARSVCPSDSEELEYKVYAAIQTPKGALFTVGSIGCAIGAYFALGTFGQPIVALILAGLCIYMFVHIK